MATDLHTLRLNVDVDVGTGPLIVLLHGINSRGSDWGEVVKRLSDRYRVIAPDLLGFGDSPKPIDLEYTTDQHAEVLEATLADLGVCERFLLVGYSMGGNVAVRYAATYPQRLRRLFLLSTPFYLPPEDYSHQGFDLEYAQAMFFTWLWKVVGRQKDRQTLLYGLATGKFAKPLEAYLRTDDVSAHWQVMARNLTNTISTATFVDDLPKLSMPTVFALGVRDPIVRPDQTAALKRLKPDLEIRRISGLTADHLVLNNAPDLVVREILRDEVSTLAVSLRQGAGAPVLLLPGMDERAADWGPVAAALATRNRVAAVDLLGFGASPVPLATHYTLEDHAAAVLATCEREFPGETVSLVGHEFGGTVALACAAEAPGVVVGVTAVSPALVPRTLSGHPASPELAVLLAERASLVEMASDERSERLMGERLETRLVPRLRSLDAVVATDAEALLARQLGPVRLVLPNDDQRTPGEWLSEVAARHPDHFQVERPSGGSGLPFNHPATLLELLGVPADEAALASPVASRPAPTGTQFLARVLGQLNRQLILRGLLLLLGGLPLLLLPFPIPPRVIAFGFGIWLVVEALQMIGGSVTLLRRGRSWIGWLVLGVLSLLFAAAVTADTAFSLNLFYWVVLTWAGLHGVASLVVAWRVRDVPGRRGPLLAEGLLAVIVTIGLLVNPLVGSRLLRWVLGGYLTASGLATLGYAYRNHRRSVQRIRAAIKA